MLALLSNRREADPAKFFFGLPGPARKPRKNPARQPSPPRESKEPQMRPAGENLFGVERPARRNKGGPRR